MTGNRNELAVDFSLPVHCAVALSCDDVDMVALPKVASPALVIGVTMGQEYCAQFR